MNRNDEKPARGNPISNVFVKGAVMVAIIFCIAMLFKLQFDYNRLRERSVELDNQLLSYEDKIERLTADLAREIDDDYIIRIAREKLNYCFPDEILFFSDR